jgi:hypothetical protein
VIDVLHKTEKDEIPISFEISPLHFNTEQQECTPRRTVHGFRPWDDGFTSSAFGLVAGLNFSLAFC